MNLDPISDKGMVFSIFNNHEDCTEEKIGTLYKELAEPSFMRVVLNEGIALF
jgi:hypothetical protein